MKKFMKKVISAVMIGAMSVSLLAGCGGNTQNGGNGEAADAAITMEAGSISMGEARLYAYVMRSQYEAYYGPEIWDMEIEEGVTFGDSMKDMITDQLIQLIILSSKADDYGVTLSDEDNASVDEYIASFKENIGEDAMAEEGITEDAIRSVIEKSTLSGYVYEAMYNEQEVELTDEEKEDARCITVQHILISTTDTTKEDAEGNTVDMTDDEKETYLAQQRAKAEEVLAKALNGEDFEKLSNEYTAENAGFQFAFDKYGYDPINMSSMVEPFYTAAWELDEGEISGLVESNYGYHIIKCVNLNNEEATAAAIENEENYKKTDALEEALTAEMEASTYTESEAWKAYRITSGAEEETTADTEEAETSGETETEAETDSEE